MANDKFTVVGTNIAEKATMTQEKTVRSAMERKEPPSCEFSFRGEEVSEAELQELIKKRDKLLNDMGRFKNHDGKFVDGTNLYQKMITYSKTKDVNRLRHLASQDDDAECGLDNLLDYCTILYQPDNYNYYAVLDENGNYVRRDGIKIPTWLPQTYGEMADHCTELCYGMMLRCLSGQKKYLAYPQFDELEKHIDELCLEECMQFFLFYNRLSLRYGQQYFFDKWKDGTALRVVKRIQQFRKNS